MKRMLINATQLDEVRVAITADSRLIDLDIEIPGQEQKKSNIYKSVITSIEPSLGAVFVNYGSKRHGFLPLKEISREYFLQDASKEFDPSDINRVLKVGQELVVQVGKEERGTKGAALTTFISLAGSFLVLMPNNPQANGISRRIEGEERDQLRETINQLDIPEGMGLIVRTAGLGRAKEELEWDLKILLRYWEAIKRAAIAKPGPYLIHQESDVVIRAIRDYLRHDIEEILIDNEKSYQNACHYINQVRPQFVGRLRFYCDQLPLFSRFQIERQIENAHHREVRLPSGGSLIIDHSEALVAIDINSARATRGTSLEETALLTNLEAAEEITRQLRIRDIGGLIVIDFIDMTPIRNQREVENYLRNALKQDRARIQIGRISKFGLLEMSRQRLRSSLTRSTQITCPRCEGEGAIRSIESLGLSIIHLIQEQASKAENIHFQLQVPVDLAIYLINEKRESLSIIEKHYPVKITVIPNQYIETPFYQLKQIKIDLGNLEHGKGISSYKLAKFFKTEISKKQKINPPSKPIVQQFLSTEKIPLITTTNFPQKTGSGGVFKRLMAKMFGIDREESLDSRRLIQASYNRSEKKYAPRKEHILKSLLSGGHQNNTKRYHSQNVKIQREDGEKGCSHRSDRNERYQNYCRDDVRVQVSSPVEYNHNKYYIKRSGSSIITTNSMVVDIKQLPITSSSIPTPYASSSKFRSSKEDLKQTVSVNRNFLKENKSKDSENKDNNN
ncbi:Rne/Rng family ribonuclease [Coxiella endosymbiont of Amblyomma sculptum]|nr:Rne/Rng family ribonuclease [Coxiella endosymbiont of Amblyomma sculptum]QHG92647.1 Rne/Rng family ribonuclease [Coxiella endosymbiont of Amblyomma sculptum]